MSLDQYPGLDFVLSKIFESAGDIKLALKDGHIEPHEIVAAIPDKAVAEFVEEMLDALSKLPDEVEQVVSSGPWGMMSLFQEVAVKAMSIFK